MRWKKSTHHVSTTVYCTCAALWRRRLVTSCHSLYSQTCQDVQITCPHSLAWKTAAGARVWAAVFVNEQYCKMQTTIKRDHVYSSCANEGRRIMMHQWTNELFGAEYRMQVCFLVVRLSADVTTTLQTWSLLRSDPSVFVFSSGKPCLWCSRSKRVFLVTL